MHVKLRTKLLLSFLLVASGAAVVGGFGLVTSQTLERANVDVTRNLLPSLRGLGQLDQGLTAVRYYTIRAQILSLRGDDRAFAEMWTAREQARRRAEEGMKLYGSLPMSAEEKVLWARLEPAYRAYMGENDQAWTAMRGSEIKRAEGILERLAGVLQADVTAPLRELQDVQLKIADRTEREGAAAASSSRVVLWSVIVLTFAVAAGIGVLLAVSVTRRLATLVEESKRLREAIAAGRLDARADAARIDAEFRPILDGMNETVEAFVRPIQVTADYVDRIAKGAIPPKITDHYEGDFDLIKQNLNRCIDAVNALVTDSVLLSRAAVEGKLGTRVEAGKHEGDYRKIVQGVNDCLDAVLNPINEAAQVLERLAQRDLRARAKGSYQGDHAKIKEALNATAEALHESLAQVAQAVEQVSSASGQIAASSEAVAAGASEQASSLEETSASLESMASMTKQAADNAQQANGLAQTAQAAATEGSAAMEQMTAAMGKIKASAEGTSQIIKDINEIAFQTNLLALNAAVEAARAGEAGRGFAVVAEEVRSLALRSKEAANKTEELIRQSVKEAGEGEVTAKHVNEKLADIGSSVTKVSGIIAEIAATAKEQTVGIDQVTKAVTQMNQVTQQNAASSEESSSAAAELSGQSEELAAMVGTFQLERQASAAKAVAKKPAGAVVQKAARPAKANGHANGHANGKNGFRVDPASVIPLDGDRGFGEF